MTLKIFIGLGQGLYKCFFIKKNIGHYYIIVNKKYFSLFFQPGICPWRALASAQKVCDSEQCDQIGQFIGLWATF